MERGERMGFSDVLKLYLDKTKCTAKELSAVSGISASALSRYRSGQRIPEQEHLEKLICGLVQLAGENAPEIGEETIRDAFSPYMELYYNHGHFGSYTLVTPQARLSGCHSKSQRRH